ncbi:MAG: DNA (cytosine-5-)-methyltransferase [Muribaculaceae bacterium]|nr:DNA (cytosine-5-)-methyltransferase [Muribaculaceae bacterium]
MTPPKFTFIDLFAGIGGFRMALEQHGGQCLGFSEIAPDAINAYCDNYHEDPSTNLGDITKLQQLPTHDFLTGGVPCQSWSIAGRNLGFDDSRGQLWNDALFLLKTSKPKVFIFENVKGLADPRNADALKYIMDSIRKAGYQAQWYLLNAYDYGVIQNRVRIYIIGFKEKKYADRFRLPQTCGGENTLGTFLIGGNSRVEVNDPRKPYGQSISVNEYGQNDYFLFNDLRSGDTTIHSWDLINTTEKEKQICNLILKNRRKRTYGPLDGNPLSIAHLKQLDASISQEDVDSLISKGILKEEKYLYKIELSTDMGTPSYSEEDETARTFINDFNGKIINVDNLKMLRETRVKRIRVVSLLKKLEERGEAKCIEVRYDFKNTKISTGLNGINRIFLPSSKVYPTLVASDSNDFVSDIDISGATVKEYKRNFMEKVYLVGKYRRISKEEACRIQGFPPDFHLPPSRARWMKLIGNSVAVNLIGKLTAQIIATGVFNESDYITEKENKENHFKNNPKVIQSSLFEEWDYDNDISYRETL